MKTIRWLAIVWFVAGLFGFVALALTLIPGNGEGFILALAMGVSGLTISACLDGFATIVGYFERAGRKQGK